MLKRTYFLQGRILSAQTAVQYALDIANALVFLRMQGFLHTELNSNSVMITSHDAAKLADVGSCAKLAKPEKRMPKPYEIYSPEPQYVNIEGKLYFGKLNLESAICHVRELQTQCHYMT